jgi:hypothetical protein
MDDLLRFSATVRRDPRIEAWFSDFADPHRLMTRAWFERMRGCGADVRELLHDGCPVACVGDAPFAYVNAFKAHANVGFFHGATLADPAGMLEGDGKRMRHVKLRPGKDLDAAALGELIEAAYRDIKERLGLARGTKAPKQAKSGAARSRKKPKGV